MNLEQLREMVRQERAQFRSEVDQALADILRKTAVCESAIGDISRHQAREVLADYARRRLREDSTFHTPPKGGA